MSILNHQLTKEFMNLESVFLIVLYASIVLITLGVFITFLFINSPTNELRDRVIHVILSVSFFGICLSYIMAVTPDVLVYIK